MAFATSTASFTDTVFNTGNNNWLIATVGSGATITGIDVIGGYGFQLSGGIAAGSWLENYIVHGIQQGNSPYTPVGVVGSPDVGNWLVHEMVRPNPTSGVFPTTPDSLLERYAFELRWRGQWVIGTAKDFYFSEGSILSGVVQWKMYAQARIYFD